MKKYLPFVFPLIAVVIIAFLGYSWYTSRTARTGTIPTFGEGVQIEDLSGSEQEKILHGMTDYKKVELKGEGEAMGEIRYEVKNGKIWFSVTAMVPEITEGHYQVWLKAIDKNEMKKAFVLEMGKAGYMGSAAVDQSLLPFEVVVTKEMTADNQAEQVVLRGSIPKQEM